MEIMGSMEDRAVRSSTSKALESLSLAELTIGIWDLNLELKFSSIYSLRVTSSTGLLLEAVASKPASEINIP